jgi:hypothetical protein
LKYIISSLPTILSALVWIGDKWLTQHLGEDFGKIPWPWVFFVTLSFLVGVVVADILNKNSSMRSLLRNKTKIAKIDHFVLASKSKENELWYEAVLQFRFVRLFKNVNCSVQITQYVGLEHAENSFIIEQETITLAESNLSHKFVVATYPKQTDKKKAVGNPYWGEDKNHSWAGDGNHIVTLKLRSGVFTQTERFLITSIRSFSTGAEPVLLFGDSSSNEYMQIKYEA